MSQRFPDVQGGGSLIVAWQVKGKNILVVGGGEVAAGRILHSLNADAKVTVVCPKSGLNDEVAFRVAQQQISHVDRCFEPHDLDDADMVLSAVDDPATSSRIWQLCKERQLPANIADIPSECDFYFGSMYRDGPLQVMVSTNGNGPKMASIVRKKIADTLPQNTGAAIVNVGKLRKKLRDVAPDISEGPKRMKWISNICELWTLEELVKMSDEDMDLIPTFYDASMVPSFDDIHGKSGASNFTSQ